MLPVCFHMMFVRPAVLYIHHPRIPFVIKCGDGKNAVMDKYPEAQPFIPVRYFICRKGLPVIFIRALIYDGLYFIQLFGNVIILQFGYSFVFPLKNPLKLKILMRF